MPSGLAHRDAGRAYLGQHPAAPAARMTQDLLPQASAAAPPAPAPRRQGVDIARGLALVGMALFHTVRDLEFFGLLPAGATLSGPWAIFARLVAGSFLALVGVSLFLGQGRGIRWRPFLRRSAVIALAAAAVSVSTLAAMPHAFVYFGILHMAVAGRFAGLAVLRLPVAAILMLAVLAWWLPALGAGLPPAPRWLAWTGLMPAAHPSLDFVPLLPWLAPCLAGLALGKWLRWPASRSAAPLPAPLRGLAWAGRHSLPIYLLHQPLLLALIWAATRVWG